MRLLCKLAPLFSAGLLSIALVNSAQAIAMRHFASVDLPIRADIGEFCLPGDRIGVERQLIPPERRLLTALVDSLNERERDAFCRHAAHEKKLKRIAEELAKIGVIVVKDLPPGLPPFGGLGDLEEALDNNPSYFSDDLYLLTPDTERFKRTFAIFEVGLGGGLPMNDPTLGATQKTGRKNGTAGNFTAYFPIIEVDHWKIMSGAQLFAGRTDNDTLKNQPPFADSPFGGRTEYVGAALLLALEATVNPQLSVNGYVGIGAAKVDFSGIQGGVEVVTGKDTVPVFKAGLSAFVPLGSDGWEIGGGFDFTDLGGFELTTNTAAKLHQGRTQDFFVGAKIRHLIGFDSMQSEQDIFEDGFESGDVTVWSRTQ